MVGSGDAALIVLLLFDGQGLSVPDLGCAKIPLLLGDAAELMVGGGSAVLVALFLGDGQGFSVPGLGRAKIPLLLGDDAELMIGASHAFFVFERCTNLGKALEQRPGLSKATAMLRIDRQ